MMKNKGRILIILSFVGLFIVVYALSQKPALTQDNQTILPLTYQLSPDLQHDVIALHAGAADIQPSMDYLSWTTFIALNWPASATENGVPDRGNVIGGVPGDPEGGKGLPAGPTVWETFKESTDIFMNPPVKPSPFNSPQRIPSQCLPIARGQARKKVILMDSKFSDFLADTTEAFTDSPLIDQNGQKVWYEVRLNEVEFDFIVKNGYYNSKNQPAVITFPSSSNTGKSAGSIHVKAAWKIMGQTDDPKRFYTTTALIYDGGLQPKCQMVQVGLVGLHIVHKTASRPEWVWSTFEQIDNTNDVFPKSALCTQPRQLPPGGRRSFYNPDCSTKDCPPNQQPGSPDSKTPVQVVRVTPIRPEVQQLNCQFQAALRQGNPKNVWQYYQLIDTQWPAAPDQTKIFGGPRPPFLANTTLETYFQGPTPPPPPPPQQPSPPHSCMNCHGQFGQNKDFLFQLGKAYPHSKTVRTKRPAR